jgi:uncharacterized glyoxalase superfamily protein PhnB
VTDPFEAVFMSLREPVVPVTPDPSFAARLRERLVRAVLNPVDQGDTMAIQMTQRAPVWPPALTPYIVVSDARAALEWYTEVLGARLRGEPHVDSDGTIGHMEVDLGDAVLMLSETSDLYPEVPVRAPDSPTTFSHSLHLDVPNVDETVVLARSRGATVEREPTDQPYGRGAVIVDPFGHRWLLLRPPADATRFRHGDVSRVTMMPADADRAKDFYEAVLGLPFTPGRTPGTWVSEAVQPPLSMWSPEGAANEVRLTFRVDDVETAAERVRAAGGTAAAVDQRPYGLVIECVDDQGTHFWLWQPGS